YYKFVSLILGIIRNFWEDCQAAQEFPTIPQNISHKDSTAHDRTDKGRKKFVCISTIPIVDDVSRQIVSHLHSADREFESLSAHSGPRLREPGSNRLWLDACDAFDAVNRAVE